MGRCAGDHLDRPLLGEAAEGPEDVSAEGLELFDRVPITFRPIVGQSGKIFLARVTKIRGSLCTGPKARVKKEVQLFLEEPTCELLTEDRRETHS
jgi:hypothetical protein